MTIVPINHKTLWVWCMFAVYTLLFIEWVVVGSMCGINGSWVHHLLLTTKLIVVWCMFAVYTSLFEWVVVGSMTCALVAIQVNQYLLFENTQARQVVESSGGHVLSTWFPIIPQLSHTPKQYVRYCLGWVIDPCLSTSVMSLNKQKIHS